MLNLFTKYVKKIEVCNYFNKHSHKIESIVTFQPNFSEAQLAENWFFKTNVRIINFERSQEFNYLIFNKIV